MLKADEQRKCQEAATQKYISQSFTEIDSVFTFALLGTYWVMNIIALISIAL